LPNDLAKRSSTSALKWDWIRGFAEFNRPILLVIAIQTAVLSLGQKKTVPFSIWRPWIE
jgi:hypothetical protein